MRPLRLSLLLAFLAIAPAIAQNETVTVTGQATNPTRTEIIRSFIHSYVTPSRNVEKIARWADPICPVAIGLKPEENGAIAQHIRNAALSAGARVKAEVMCRPNVTVVFAQDPQDLMTQIAAHYNLAKTVMGDIDGPMHARMLAKITYPIQAWYGTEIEDAWGTRVPSQGGMLISTGSRLNNGIKSDFTTVFVVVDLSKVAGREVGTIGDYVAMLTLSQTKNYGACLQIPSISNLLAPDCDDRLRTTALSDADIAFLRGVYKMDGGDKFNLARGAILDEMEKSPVSTDLKAPAK